MVHEFATPGGTPPTPDPNAPESRITASTVATSHPVSEHDTGQPSRAPRDASEDIDELKAQLTALRAEFSSSSTANTARFAQLSSEAAAAKQRENFLLQTLADKGKVTSPSEPVKVYLDTTDLRHEIAPGLNVHPALNESNKPHPYSLHTDPAHAALVSANKDAAIKELTTITTSVFYLSCALVALHQYFPDNGPDDTYAELQPVLNTLDGVEEGLRDRLALCRGYALDVNGAANPLLKTIEEKTYGKHGANHSGSKNFEEISEKFQASAAQAFFKAHAAASANAKVNKQKPGPGPGAGDKKKDWRGGDKSDKGKGSGK